MKAENMKDKDIDNRTEIMKKIDDLWDIYCDQFQTVIFIDQYNLTEEDFYEIMKRSVDENIDYLSHFEISDIDIIHIISDINKGCNSEIEAQLRRAYNELKLQNINVEEQYAILNYLFSSINNLVENVGSIIDGMIITMKEMNLEEIKAITKPYIWIPKELSELKRIRETVLDCALNKSDNNVTIDITEINKRISDLFNIVQITNYKYRNRSSVLLEFEYLKGEIEKDVKYVTSGDSNEFGSIGLQDKINGTGGFVTEDFATESGFKSLQFGKID